MPHVHEGPALQPTTLTPCSTPRRFASNRHARRPPTSRFFATLGLALSRPLPLPTSSHRLPSSHLPPLAIRSHSRVPSLLCPTSLGTSLHTRAPTTLVPTSARGRQPPFALNLRSPLAFFPPPALCHEFVALGHVTSPTLCTSSIAPLSAPFSTCPWPEIHCPLPSHVPSPAPPLPTADPHPTHIRPKSDPHPAHIRPTSDPCPTHI